MAEEIDKELNNESVVNKKKEEKKGPRLWEKERRDRMKVVFDDLMRLLPKYDGSMTMSRIEILQNAISYIKDLKSQNEDLLNGGFDDIYKTKMVKCKRRINELLSRIDQLSNLLRSAKIPLPPFAPVPLGDRTKKWASLRENKLRLRKENDINKVVKKENTKKRKSAPFKSVKPAKKKKLMKSNSEKSPIQKENQSSNANANTIEPLPKNVICPTSTYLVTPQGNLLPLIQPNPTVVTPIVIQRPPQVLVLQKQPQVFQVVAPSPAPTFPLTLRKTPLNKRRISRATTVTTYVNKKPIPALLSQKKNDEKKDQTSPKTPPKQVPTQPPVSLSTTIELNKSIDQPVVNTDTPTANQIVSVSSTINHQINVNERSSDGEIATSVTPSVTKTIIIDKSFNPQSTVGVTSSLVSSLVNTNPKNSTVLSLPKNIDGPIMAAKECIDSNLVVSNENNEITSKNSMELNLVSSTTENNPTSSQCSYDQLNQQTVSWVDQPNLSTLQEKAASTSTQLSTSYSVISSSANSLWSYSDTITSWSIPQRAAPLEPKKNPNFVEGKSVKTQKDTSVKAHINWMTDPDVRATQFPSKSQDVYIPDEFCILNDKTQKFPYQAGVSYGVDYCFGGYQDDEKSKRFSGKKKPEQELFSQDYFSWSSSKIDSNIVVPCTLPTLIGDLALGTSSLNESVDHTDPLKINKGKDEGKQYVELAPLSDQLKSNSKDNKCNDLLINNPFIPDLYTQAGSVKVTKDNQKSSIPPPEPFTNLSKNIFDVTASEVTRTHSLNETIVLKNIFELPPTKSSTTSLKRASVQQNSFLSVSQLVDSTGIESTEGFKNDSNPRHTDTSPSFCPTTSKSPKAIRKSKCDKKFPEGNCKFPSNYSAESLIRSNYSSTELTPLPHIYSSYESNKQDPLLQNVYSDFNFSSPVPNFTLSGPDYLSHDSNIHSQSNFLGDLINTDYTLTENNSFPPPCSMSINHTTPPIAEKKAKNGKPSNARHRKDLWKSPNTFSSSFSNNPKNSILPQPVSSSASIITFTSQPTGITPLTTPTKSSTSFSQIDNRYASSKQVPPMPEFSVPYFQDTSNNQNLGTNNNFISGSTSSSTIKNATSKSSIDITSNYSSFPHQSTNNKYFSSSAPPIHRINHKTEMAFYAEPEEKLKTKKLPDPTLPIITSKSIQQRLPIHYSQSSDIPNSTPSFTPFPPIPSNHQILPCSVSKTSLTLPSITSSLSYTSPQFALSSYTTGNQYNISGSSSNLYNQSSNNYNQPLPSLPNYKSVPRGHSITMNHSNSIFSTTLTTSALSFPPPACSFAPIPTTTTNTNTSVSNTLTNFNLSTIFPEINKKASYPIYP